MTLTKSCLIGFKTCQTKEFSRNYTKLVMLSTLYCFVVKGELISAKSLLPAVGIEPATPTPKYFHHNAYPSVPDPHFL